MTSVWSEHRTKEGRVYYYNSASKKSTWEKPEDFDGASAATANAGTSSTSSNAAAGSGTSSDRWEELWDPKNARPYYYHRATRKTQWLKPEGVEIKLYTGARTTAAESSSGERDKDRGTKDKEKEKTPRGKSGEAEAKEKEGGKHGAGVKRSSSGSSAHVNGNGRTRQGTSGSAGDGAAGSSGGGIAKAGVKRVLLEEGTSGRKMSASESNEQVQTAQEQGGENDDSANGEGDMELRSVHAKKRRKKTRKEKENAHANVSSTVKKRPRKASERMIICDDEDRRNWEATKAVHVKDAEDGQEASRWALALAETDAIMDANILSVINAFLRTHTEPNGPEVLVEKLSSSYRGRAQMVGLVASWLDALPVPKTALERKLTLDAGNANGSNTKKVASWNPATEIMYEELKDIIEDHYEPDRMSNVLSDSVTEPEWLTEMLGDKKWRMMLIELAGKHQTCTLLQYAVRRISEAGHHKELATISNANAVFSVFKGILLDAFCRIPFASDEDAHEDLTALKMICCRSAYSYMYAEELLCTLDHKLFVLQDDESAATGYRAHYRTVRSNLSRVRLELEELAIEKFGAKMEAFHPLHRRSLYDANKSLSDAISSIVKTKKCSEAAADMLLSAYQFYEDAPPVAHLRDPLVFRSLLDPLFNPSEPLPESFASNCIHLLTYASCATDERSILHTNTVSAHLDEDEVAKTKAALEEASNICRSDHTLSFNMNQTGVVERLAEVMRVPVASIGVLHWLEVTLRSPTFFNSSLLHICFPSLLRILKEAIRFHVAQWPIAFRLLVVSLRLHPDVNPVKALELKRESLDSMIFMITRGYVLPVLAFILANILELDQALLRNFVTVLFAQIAPPYSAKFVDALAKVLTHPKVQHAIKSCPPEFKVKLQGFVSYCKKNPSVLAADRLQALVSTQEAM